MIRVLHVYKDYYPVLGGIENHVKLMAEQLAPRDDIDVRVLTTNPGLRTRREVIEGVEVVKAGRIATVASTPLSFSLFREMAQWRADIIHLHFPYPLGELAYLLRGGSSRAVITYHSDVVRQQGLLRLYRPFLWRVLNRVDRVIATSANYVESSPFLSQIRQKCQIIPLGIDTKRFESVGESAIEDWHKRFPGPKILFVGRFRYYKGLRYLIEAMHQIDATLLLSGSGPLEAELRTQVMEAGLGGKVIFLGEVSDDVLPSLYHAADIFVLPAVERSEAFGLTQVEAMASGTPCICTEVGTGTSWVNVHDETGLVIPPRQSIFLTEAINRLLGDDDLRRSMGENARKRAQKEFSVDRMVKDTVSIYKSLAAG
jgi:rhamnosyl/mannosyltransferase